MQAIMNVLLTVLLAVRQVRWIHRGAAGLGDAVVGLAKEIRHAHRYVDLRIVTLAPDKIPEGFQRLPLELKVRLDGQVVTLAVFEGRLPATRPGEAEVPCYLLQCPDSLRLECDSLEEAILLAQGALELARKLPGFRPDVINTHDWHAALAAVYRDELYRHDPYLRWVAIEHTIHNMMGPAFQGAFDDVRRAASRTGLSGLVLPGKTRSVEHYGWFNCTKAALAFAEVSSTVSITHAGECGTPAFAHGLEAVVRERGLFGVPDGINIYEFDPATDPSLGGFNYDADTLPEVITAQKKACRQLLRNWVAPDGRRPFANLSDTSSLIGQVSRIDFQKIAVLAEAIDHLRLIPDTQFIILGEPHAKDAYGKEKTRDLAQWTADPNGQVMMYTGFDIALSHLIYAASELFVVASSHEPFGLTAPIAMRYGSVPVVRATGGLADTVLDERAGPEANGFSFKEFIADQLQTVDVAAASQLFVETVRRAVDLRQSNLNRWLELVRNGMTRDSSWAVPAAQYVRLYQEALRRRTEIMRVAG